MTNLEQIKKGIEIVNDPARDPNIPEDGRLFFDEFYFPLVKALKEKDQEVIEYFKTSASADEQALAYTAFERVIGNLSKDGIIAESANSEYAELFDVYPIISNAYKVWKEASQKAYEEMKTHESNKSETVVQEQQTPKRPSRFNND